MIALADARRLAAFGLALALAAMSAAADEPAEPASQSDDGRGPEAAAAPAKPVCLGAADTREMVRSRHFIEPYAALKFAATQRKAEALSARLCHTGDEFFYDITVLHRDGRLVRVHMNAATGKPIPRAAREAKEPPPKN